MTEVFHRRTIRPFLWLPAYSDLIRRKVGLPFLPWSVHPKTFPRFFGPHHSTLLLTKPSSEVLLKQRQSGLRTGIDFFIA